MRDPKMMPSFPKTAVLLFFFLCLSILFNIPVVQQILGFLWLTLIPGYAFLRILKIDEWDLLDLVVFSAGSGLAITVLVSLILNFVAPFLNLPEPLSAIPFTAALGSLTLVLLLLGRNRERKNPEGTFPKETIKLADIPQILVLATVIALSIIGALYQNISFLLLMIIGVAVLIAICALSERWIPSKLFPLVIVSCSVALLFHTALISKHLMGVDIFLEFYVFTQTKTRGFWIAPGNIMQYSLIDDLNSLLSVTTLPATGTSVLGLDGEAFFKLFYPLVFSIVPLALYRMYQRQIDTKSAFLSVMFFISAPTVFYGIEPLALCRQMVGLLFLALSLMLMLDKRLVVWKRRVLLILLVAALTTAHYALVFILLFYILIFYVAPRALSFLRMKLDRQALSLGMILLIVAITFLWYTYVSSSPLNHMLSSFQRIGSMFSQDFSSPEARGFGGALSSLSPLVATSIVGLTHKILVYTEFFFIGTGLAVMLIKPKVTGVSREYRLFSFASAALLALCLIVPNFSLTLNFTRFYAIVILLLAPFFVIGGVFLVRLFFGFVSKFSRNARRINLGKPGIYVVTFVLIAAFLFQVGFVNHVTNDYPYSYSLDLNRKEMSNSLSIKIDTHSLYFLDQEVRSAYWLAKMADADINTYADWYSQSSVLKSYATLQDTRMIQITNDTRPKSQTYIYLKYITTQLGLVSLPNGEYLDVSAALPTITSFNTIYSNGISEIYFVP